MVDIVTCYSLLVLGANSGGGEIFHAVKTGLGAFCTMGRGSFQGVMWMECGAVHPPSPGL
jgi:hypothetical protein